MKWARSPFQSTLQWHPWGAGERRVPTPLLWIALLASIALLMWLVADLAAVQSDRERLAAEAAQVDEKIVSTPGTPKITASGAQPSSVDRETRRGLNQMIAHLNTPWPSILDALERATPPHIALLRIEPESGSTIAIEAEAKDIDLVVAYAGDLAHRGVFGDVRLQRHITNDQDPNRPARLTFSIALRESPWR
ncbi:PilN domain-containing protein [Comamonas testosteroni]|uniref:PilN domain-containing protein n=1 Tax=Comamonas testosteroni TaxID=285 RepID=UPI0006A5BE3B|nr:PilN domain-containing protein [Comamonas testosteroni]